MSMVAARRAGLKAARAAEAPTTSTTAAITAPSNALVVEKLLDQPKGPGTGEQSQGKAACDGRRHVPYHLPANRRSRGAQGHSNADFRRSRRHRIAQDAVDSKHRQQQPAPPKAEMTNA